MCSNLPSQTAEKSIRRSRWRRPPGQSWAARLVGERAPATRGVVWPGTRCRRQNSAGLEPLIFVPEEVSDRPVTSLRRVVVWLTGSPRRGAVSGRPIVALALSARQ